MKQSDYDEIAEMFRHVGSRYSHVDIKKRIEAEIHFAVSKAKNKVVRIQSCDYEDAFCNCPTCRADQRRK